MKNKILLLLLTFFTLLSFGCKAEHNNMYIDCSDTLIIEQSMELKVYYNHEEIPMENLDWTLSDYSIANIIDGKLYALDYGYVVIGVIDTTNPQNYCSKRVEIVEPFVEDIIVEGKHEVYIDKTIKLTASVKPSIIESEIIWSSSNEEIIIVDEGEVYAVGLGVADVIIQCDDFEKRYEITVLPTPTTIDIYGDTNLLVNEIAELTFNIEEEVTLQSSNSEVVSVVDNAIIGISEGTAVITAVKVIDNSVKGTIEVVVKQGTNTSVNMSVDESKKINDILSTMTLDQMIGEMFNIGFYTIDSGWGEPVGIEPTTGLPYAVFGRNDPQISVLEYLKNYKFGNFTLHYASGKSRQSFMTATKTLKSLAVENTGVNPFISINTTGGYLMNAITALPTNEALSNASIQVISEINDLYSLELKALGINTVLNPYANNNYQYNNSLNTYSNNISKAMATAAVVSNAYKKNNVIMIPDISAYYQWTDERTFEELSNTDLKLMLSAIQNGSPIISLPATIYTQIDDTAYAVVSEKIIKTYIREQLKYDGVLMMSDAAISNLVELDVFYEYVAKAINLGIDMIGLDLNFSATGGYWGSNYRQQAEKTLGLYNYLISCVQNNEISEERIKEAVTRILLVKLRNNVLSDEINTEEFNFTKNTNEIISYAPKFITINGEGFTLEKDESILVISESYESTGTTNSLGDNFRNFFGNRGFGGIDIYHANTLYPETILRNAGEYDKIIICISNLTETTNIGFGANRVNFIQFVKEMLQQNDNLCVIATASPNAMNYLPEVKNSILLYNYYEDNFESLCKVLNNEV